MTVKVIPNSDEYRAGWEKTFRCNHGWNDDETACWKCGRTKFVLLDPIWKSRKADLPYVVPMKYPGKVVEFD